jgi:hypothetical protein
MTTNEVRLFMEVTTRQAEEMFSRQLDACNRRIELDRAGTRLRLKQGPNRKAPGGLAGFGSRGGRSTARRIACSRLRRVHP